MSKARKAIISIIVAVLGLFAMAATITTYAYFSKKEIYDGFLSGEVELLFDRLSEEGMAAYQETDDTITVNDDSWGTKEYPYVISDVRHLYNLSELQRLGYFYKTHISKNEAGNYSNIPYFLVCTPDYKPALIDGTNFKGITSIGTDKYPFIGSVRGVQSALETITVDGKTCDTSAIYNVKVSGNPANADVGLFGHVGFLGDSQTVDENTGTFTGQISTLSNLVLVDIQITVKSSLWEKVTAFLEDIAILPMGGHRYSFTDLYNTTDYNLVPHENHHIGILVGHASYATVEYISVYYTSGEVVAIDLHDETEVDGIRANYLSATGILGFIDNINPTVVPDANGNMSVSAGSGDSLGDLSYGTAGGGGISSGTKPGYVLATEMYSKYRYTQTDGVITEDDDGTIYLKDAVSADGSALCTEWIRDRILWGTEATGRYYFYDGVFTFALSSQEDVIEPTWKDAPDEFSIGRDDDSAWKTNYSKGNNAVVAYVDKITSNSELNAAIAAGKQIFIMQESDEDIFLMSLYNQSATGSGDFETKYSTPGVTQKFGTEEFVRSLIESYEGGDLELPKDMTGYTLEELVYALENGNLRAINVGITSSTVSLEELKEKYKITANTTGSYSYFDENNIPVQVNADGTVNEYYDYSQSGYDGYLYFTYEKRVEIVVTRTYYTYYWQTKDSVTKIGESSYTWTAVNTPSDVFVDTGAVWGGTTSDKQEKIYNYNGTEYTGIVVNKTDGVFYGTGNAANANGPDLTIAADNTINYFYKDADGKIFHSLDRQTEITIPLTDTGDRSLSGQSIYSANGKTGILLSQYPTYLFSSGNNYLRMIKAVFSSYGNKYAIWNGTDEYAEDRANFAHKFVAWSEATTSPSSISNSTQATLRFSSDGTCYIQFGIDSVGLYVHSTGSVFNTATSYTMDGTKLCIYVVEGTQNINYGRITFDPIDDTTDETDCYTFNAGETVLFASSTHTNDANGYISSTDTEYTVMSLEQLGWNNGSGQVVSVDDLQSKFKMVKGITFGASFNLLNGTLGSGGIITAPVGTNGTEANIPQSCIAFRINNANKENKIRVIVSVAVSELYPTEAGYDLGDYTIYFNLWKMEEAGQSTVQVFNATGENLLDRFEVPRSHPYEPGKTAAVSEYIIVSYNDKLYRCYLNGDRVLLAYEFSVDTTTEGQGVGVFCMGMSGIDADGNAVEDVPMEIVYFSAEGVASAGRDGASSSQIGTIDFVYDYENVIVTVKETSETDESGNEVYSNYYPSYCLMYFDTAGHADNYTEEAPAYIDVNYEYIRVRRYVIEESETPDSDENHNDTPSRTKITAILGGDKKTRIVQYSRYADNVEIE